MGIIITECGVNVYRRKTGKKLKINKEKLGRIKENVDKLTECGVNACRGKTGKKIKLKKK